MGLRLVSDARDDHDGTAPTVGDVEAEARRRIAALGYARHAVRAQATGISVPTEIKVRYLQITAVSLALCALESIPDDYRSDVYWPI